MHDLAQLLKEHYDNHPEMEIQDAVKFLHQSFMGPGHLISEEALALNRLESEWGQVEGDPLSSLYEPLGNGVCRLHLSACKGIQLSMQTVARLFFLTAQGMKKDPSGLEQALNLVEQLPFPQEGVGAHLDHYRAQGCPMVSHSPAYRSAYSPAYRVVFSDYVNYIPLLAAIDGQLAGGGPVRVAIDGPCASGKSTLGALLKEIYRCPLIHMDDFFLRPEQRTPERLAQPGGNVDHERFDREVLSPLSRGEAAHYRPWQCGDGSFGPEITVEPGPLTVVEGCYSLRPDLRERYTLRVWLEAPWEVRRERLLKRGGPGCLERFQQQWIPLEDRYFQACRVQECCGLTLSGT